MQHAYTCLARIRGGRPEKSSKHLRQATMAFAFPQKPVHMQPDLVGMVKSKHTFDCRNNWPLHGRESGKVDT